MKLTKYMLPYPVLGLDGAFNDNCHVSVSLTFETTLANFVFHVKLEMDDSIIQGFINEGKAAFSCEVDCSKTFYRKVFLSKKKDFDIEIPRTALLGDVNFFFSAVALQSIEEYTNDNMNSRYYYGYSFNLQKGHLLVYFGEHIIDASIKYDELKALGSIVEVKEDSKENFTYYDFSGEKIRIFLPSAEFRNFTRSNNNILADITHASIVQCSLISALNVYKEYKNTLWARTLKVRVQTESKLKQFDNLDDLDNKQISQLVNILLDNANKRMFSTIDSLRSNSL